MIFGMILFMVEVVIWKGHFKRLAMIRPWLLNIGKCYLCGHILEWSIGWGNKNWGNWGPWFVHVYPTIRTCDDWEYREKK